MLKAAIFVGLRQFRQHRFLHLATLGSLALGVALVASLDLAMQGSRAAIARLDAFETGGATHQVRAPGRALTDAEAFAVIARVSASSPLVRATLTAADGTSYVLLGVDPLREKDVRDPVGEDALAREDFARWMTEPGAVFASARTLARRGWTAGKPVTAKVGARPAIVRPYAWPAAFDRAAGGSSWFLGDIATVQELAGRVGEVDLVNLRLAPGETPSLPPGLRLVDARVALEGSRGVTRSFEFNLFALSLLGLLVSSFLVFSAMHFSVSERRAQFGLLRVMGFTTNQVVLLVLGEAAVLGLGGALIGLPLGAALGRGTVFLVSRTLRDLYGQVHVADVRLGTHTMALGLGLALVFALAGALIPAWGLRADSPVATTRAAETRAERRRWRRRTLGIALGCAILAGTACWIPTLGASFAVALFAVLAGVFLLPGTLAGAFVLAGRALRGWTGFLGAAHGGAGVRVSWFGTAALTVALAMTLAIAQMVSSFRVALTHWMGQVMRGDFYVSPDSLLTPDATDGFVLDRGAVDRITRAARAVDPRAAVHTLRTLRAATARGEIGVAAISRAADPQGHVMWKSYHPADEMRRRFAGGGVLLSEPLARRMGWTDARWVTYATPTGPRTAEVLGIFREYGNAQGVMHLAHDAYRAQWRDERVSAAEITASAGADQDAIRAALEGVDAGGQRWKIQSNAEIREQALSIFDQTFAVTKSLQWVSLAIAFLGILAAQGARRVRSAAERRVFRMLGCGAKDEARIALVDSAVHAAVAGIAAALAGTLLAWILIALIQVRAFGWSFDLVVSGAALLRTVALAFVGTIAALLPFAFTRGREALKEAA